MSIIGNNTVFTNTLDDTNANFWIGNRIVISQGITIKNILGYQCKVSGSDGVFCYGIARLVSGSWYRLTSSTFYQGASSVPILHNEGGFDQHLDIGDEICLYVTSADTLSVLNDEDLTENENLGFTNTATFNPHDFPEILLTTVNQSNITLWAVGDLDPLPPRKIKKQNNLIKSMINLDETQIKDFIFQSTGINVVDIRPYIKNWNSDISPIELNDAKVIFFGQITFEHEYDVAGSEQLILTATDTDGNEVANYNYYQTLEAPSSGWNTTQFQLQNILFNYIDCTGNVNTKVNFIGYKCTVDA